MPERRTAPDPASVHVCGCGCLGAARSNVVKFYDNFVDNGVMHILMEFATGGTLYKQIVNREVCAWACARHWGWCRGELCMLTP